MCTSIAVNKNKTIVGFNLDILDMEWRIREEKEGVYIEINDAKEGWMPLFGANSRGDFVGMPTCWPFDPKSDPVSDEANIIDLDFDLLLQKRTVQEIKEYAQNNPICSIPNLTFMGALSDRYGNTLYIVPGQGFIYKNRPEYTLLTNFSPFKGESETHPWMGLDRYEKAEKMLKEAGDDFDVKDCFAVLKEVAQKVCPTVVSMVYDIDEGIVYWCQGRNWNDIHKHVFNRNIGYCGINCFKCDAYLATRNNDEKLRERTAKLWSKLNQTEILPSQINCEGCRYDGVKTIFCDQFCQIRKCAMNKKVETCGECLEMSTCEKLSAIIAHNPEAKSNLEKLNDEA